MKYLDVSNNMFYDSQNEDNTLIPYDNEYFSQIYTNARNGVVYDVNDIQLPSFISREQMQSALWTAELIYLQSHNGSQERIAELQTLLNPETPEQNEDETGDGDA